MASKSDDANVKIADFGFAAKVKGFSLDSQCGTPGYIAPEILEQKSYGQILDSSLFLFIIFHN